MGQPGGHRSHRHRPPTPVDPEEFLAICQLSRALCHLGHAALVEQSFGEVFVRAKLEELSATCNAVAEEQKRKAMAMAEGVAMWIWNGADGTIHFSRR